MKKSLLSLCFATAALLAGAKSYTGALTANLGTNVIESEATVTIEPSGANYTVTIGEFPAEVMGMDVVMGPVAYNDVVLENGVYKGSASDVKIAQLPRFGAVKLVQVDLEAKEEGGKFVLASNGSGTIGGQTADCSIKFEAAAGASETAEGVYYSEDFEWLAEPWGAYKSGEKEIGNTVDDDNLDAYCPFIDTPKYEYNGEANVTPKAALEATGMSFLYAQNGKTEAEAAKSCYMQKYYLKFGKGNHQSGIAITGVKGVPAGKEVAVAFDWSTMRQGDGTMDPTKLVVIVENGTDKKTYDVPEHGLEADSRLRWIHAAITLTGVTVNENTKITIRPEDAQWGVAGQHRWFIDNIKVCDAELAAIGEIAVETEVDVNAPVEYFNIQGIRVNGENLPAGLYIRRQGNKATKILVR
ncbi:MAG: hypothetical protein NC338_03455 [Firmicutes bacterium]|nr:hypothetical protein [Bacillota bacterium]MCM1401292.1 hypothetical protein [Bacteroides sp.]MCM1476753.1 hypothetical protein [Bacteroides sp.]